MSDAPTNLRRRRHHCQALRLLACCRCTGSSSALGVCYRRADRLSRERFVCRSPDVPGHCCGRAGRRRDQRPLVGGCTPAAAAARKPRPDQRAIRHGQVFVSAQIATTSCCSPGFWRSRRRRKPNVPVLPVPRGHQRPAAADVVAALQGIWRSAVCGMCLAQSRAGWRTTRSAAARHQRPPRPAAYTAIAVAVNALAIFGTLYFTDRIGRVLDRVKTCSSARTALEQSRQAIQELQRRRSRFMQTAAHQLKSRCDGPDAGEPDPRRTHQRPAGHPATCEKIARRCREAFPRSLSCSRWPACRTRPRRHREAVSDVGQVVAEICAPIPRSPARSTSTSPGTFRGRRLARHVHRPTWPTASATWSITPSSTRPTAVLSRSGSSRPKSARRRRTAAAARTTGGAVADFVFVIVEDTGIGW